MSLRERLQAKGLPESTITVSGEKFLIVGLSRSSRSSLFASCKKADGKSDVNKLESMLLSKCVLDPESREQVFGVDECSQWDGLPASITGPLMAEIMKLNGLDDDDVGREVKNSDTTASNA